MSLQEEFISFVRKNKLFGKKESLLVAVSGGIDSVVASHLLISGGFSVAIAHCNFQLRGADSDKDAAFVKNLARKAGVPYYQQNFDTKKYCSEKKMSVQMGARELRYDWFNELVKVLGFKYLITAHHADDSLETMIFNLARGTGIDGLKGILHSNGHIRRPLIFASRDQIAEHAKKYQLEWREDQSNQEDQYARNYIRQHVVPVLQKQNPALIERSVISSRKISLASGIFKAHIEKLRKKYIEDTDGVKSLRLNVLRASKDKETLLFYLLRDFDVNWEQSVSLLENHSSGKQVITPSHILTLDRKHIFIRQKKDRKPIDIRIHEYDSEISLGNSKFIRTTKGAPGKISNDESSASLDFHKLRFPLLIRQWKEGDYFQPLGMKGKKKVSDYLIDNKVPLSKKGDVLVLSSDKAIVWVIGHRIDDRFKITENTQIAYVLKLSEK